MDLLFHQVWQLQIQLKRMEPRQRPPQVHAGQRWTVVCWGKKHIFFRYVVEKFVACGGVIRKHQWGWRLLLRWTEGSSVNCLTVRYDPRLWLSSLSCRRWKHLSGSGSTWRRPPPCCEHHKTSATGWSRFWNTRTKAKALFRWYNWSCFTLPGLVSGKIRSLCT